MQVASTCPLLAFLLGLGAVFRLARCVLNWVCVFQESVLLCAPVWDLLWHKAVSKSEKADLKVLTCTPLSSAPEGPMSTVAEKFLYRRALCNP